MPVRIRSVLNEGTTGNRILHPAQTGLDFFGPGACDPEAVFQVSRSIR
jgi:hypothetical protein